MIRRPISKRARFEVLTRCNYSCFYCGLTAHLGVVQLEVEHVIPVSQGGTDDPWNLVAACRDCNAGKSAESPSDDLIARAALLYDSWAGKNPAVRLCVKCRRPWVPDADDLEPNDECWPCIRAWCDGIDFIKGREWQ